MSIRSKGSTSEESQDRAKAIKDCCRIFIELIFTQVGVGCLVVCYTIVGAIAFQSLETMDAVDDITEVVIRRSKAVEDLWNITTTFNTLNRRLWNETTHEVIKQYQKDIISYIKDGYDERTVEERWTFPSALMFTLSVITMIGYGNLVPRTKWGKIVTMLYAVFGIPVYILYFMNMGKVFANIFKWLYRNMFYCNARRRTLNHYNMMENEMEETDTLKQEEEVLVPSTACIWVMLAYLSMGTIMFAEWEGWNYLDSVYFCVTSLLKIGLGDFVPGSHAADSAGHLNHIKLYVSFLYLLLGMGVVAMNYYLLREEVMVRISQVRKKITECSAKVKYSMQRTSEK